VPSSRCIRLYTNAGEVVIDPFMGIGSSACVAIEQGRNAIGFELKDSYYAQAVRNAKKAQKATAPVQMSIYDLLGEPKEVATE